MNSEKVKEIKTALEFMMKLDLSNKLPYIDGYTPKQIAYEEIFNYINELESENEKLNSRCRNLEINYNKTWKQYREYEVENQQLKDRIAELENGIAKSMLGCEFLPECNNEKLKQFAERLKEKIQNCSGCYIPDCFESPTNEFAYSEIEVNKAIDEILKEFLEE